MTRWLENDRRAEAGRGLKSESADDDDDDDDHENEDEDDEGVENGVMLQSPHHSGNSRIADHMEATPSFLEKTYVAESVARLGAQDN